MKRPAFALMILLAACDNASKVAPAPAASQPAETATAAPTATATAAAHTEPVAADWDVPASWEAVKPGEGERDVAYKIKPASGDTEAALVSVRAGGSIDALADRWKALAKPAQADAVKRADRKVKGYEVAVIEIRGATSVLGAIVMSAGRAALEKEPAGEAKQKRLASDDEEGGGPLVIEVRGPEKTVSAAKADFDKVVESLRPR